MNYTQLTDKKKVEIDILLKQGVNVNIKMYKKWNISVYKKWNIDYEFSLS